MKTLTWDDVQAKVEERAKRNFDFYAEPKHVKVADDGTLLAFDSKTRQPHELKFNAVGLGQLATKIGVPSRYAATLAEKDTELLAVNMNRWIGELPQDKPLLLRGTNAPVEIIDGEEKRTIIVPTCRAVLSNRYGILDNDEFVRAVLAGFQGLGLDKSLNIQEFWMNDTSFHIRLADKEHALDAAKKALEHMPYDMMRKVLAEGGERANDFLFPMLHASNSEVGFLSVGLEGGVYRVLCTNGLVVPVNGDGRGNRDTADSFKKRHFGFDTETLKTFVLNKAQEILRSAGNLAERFADAQGEVLEDPSDVLERLAHKHRLTKGVQKAVRAELHLGDDRTEVVTAGTVLARIATGNLDAPGGLDAAPTPTQAVTKYDMVNALTHVAKGLAPEGRLDLERIAARLLSKN